MPVTTPPPPVAAPRSLAAANLPRRVRTVLERALTLVSVELDHSLAVLVDEFEQELFRLADVARNPTSESGYMRTLRTFRMNRADLVPHLMLELEASVAGVRQRPAGVGPLGDVPAGFASLSLVEDAAMDESSVLRDIATRLEGRASLALHLLAQRFGVLAGGPAPDAERMPLGPQALCRAMRHASLSLEIDHDARLLLYRLFDRHVMSAYGRVLEKLDAAMAGDGILPGLTYVPFRARPVLQNGEEPLTRAERRARGEDAAAPGTATAGGRRRADRAGGAQPESQPAARGARAASEPNRPHTAWMGESAGPASDQDDEAAYQSLQQLMSGRRALISKLRPMRPGHARAELETPDIDRVLGDLQRQPTSPTGSASGLSDIKQTLLAQARQQLGHGARLSQQDDDTFELLNMLYGQIEGEIRPDAPATALVRRLQLPLLRVALQDSAFFVRGDHPARQLLNTVAESAAKWLDTDDFDPQLLPPLQQAVNHVVERYDGDAAVFEESNSKLQASLQAQVRKAELLERRHVEAARGKEKLEIAKLRTATTLASLVGDQRLPKFTRALLNQAWADVLTLTLLRHGEESPEWLAQLEATRRIIGACGRPDAPADPALTHHVEAALAQVGYQGDEAGVIAQRLTSSLGEEEDDPASRTELAMKVKARARLGEDAAQQRKPTLPPRTPEENQRYEQLRVMPFGIWIEFITNQQGDVVRRRLSWYSPLTDNALFVNQRGQRVGEHSLDSLARMLAKGQARIVTSDRGRLVDRAWHAAVTALRSFASRGDTSAGAEAGA